MSVIRIDPAEMARLTNACRTTEQKLGHEVQRLQKVMSALEEQARLLQSVNEEIAATASSMYSTGTQVRATWQGATADRFDQLLPQWDKASKRQAELVRETSTTVDRTQEFLAESGAAVTQLSSLLAQTSQVIASMVQQMQSIDAATAR